MSDTPLTRHQALQRLVASEPEIRALGVERLALFGSVARDQARADSDVDVLVQFIPGAKTYDRFLALAELLEARLGHRVELDWLLVGETSQMSTPLQEYSKTFMYETVF